MALVHFTANLMRHRPVPSVTADGETLRAVFDGVFEDDPLLRGYILDEQGRLRRHVNVFIDGAMLKDRRGLSDRVGPDAEIHVIQALSGG